MWGGCRGTTDLRKIISHRLADERAFKVYGGHLLQRNQRRSLDFWVWLRGGALLITQELHNCIDARWERWLRKCHLESRNEQGAAASHAT